MENKNKSVVYIYSSWAVLNLNIILPFYLLYFDSSYSHYLIINLVPYVFHSMHFFPIQKKLSLSLSLSHNFFFIFCRIYYYYLSCISTLDWWMVAFFRILLLLAYNWKMKSMKNNKYFKKKFYKECIHRSCLIIEGRKDTTW